MRFVRSRAFLFHASGTRNQNVASASTHMNYIAIALFVLTSGFTGSAVRAQGTKGMLAVERSPRVRGSHWTAGMREKIEMRIEQKAQRARNEFKP